jgi:murein DD-endopeptidase MepM/ murein hydrolase activator NlpD
LDRIRAIVVSGTWGVLLFILGACANPHQPEPVRVRSQPVQGAPAMWPEPQLEVSQAELSLQVSSRALAVVEMARAGGVPPALPPTPVEKSMAWPVEGRLSQPFGCSPFYTALAGPGCPAEAPWFHDGLDLAVPVGTSVRAGLSGTVIFAGPDGSGPTCGDDRGYGLGVVIDDGDDRQALYAHLSRIDIVAGQLVTPATVIGASGATGCVSGPHLHFGLRLADRLVDPLAYLPPEP